MLSISKLKKVLDLSNPLAWYVYIPYILGLFFFVLLFSALICTVLYGLKDIIEYVSETSVIKQTYAGRRSFINLFTIVVTMVATMTALASPALAMYWSVKQDKRMVNGLTYDLIKEWREETLTKSASALSGYFQAREDERRAKHKLFDFVQKRENEELKISIRRLLNYCEAVASAYERGHVDTELVKSYFESVFIIYHDRLLPYIRRVQQSPKHVDIVKHTTALVYSDFDILVEKWKRQRETESN